jgi:hypothetical protein
MQLGSTIVAFVMTVTFSWAAERVTDITNSDAKTFKAHLGKTVSIQGRLSNGVQGAGLFGAIPKGVSFYVIPIMPPSGRYTWPPEWNHFGKQIRVTGELKFRSFDRSGTKGMGDDGVPTQIPPDYDYMELQHTKLEVLPSK